MEELRKRASFIHVDVPGQEDGSKDLPAEYVVYSTIFRGSFDRFKLKLPYLDLI